MEEHKEQELEQILNEVAGEQPAPEKPVFKLDLDLDSEYGEPIPMTVADPRAQEEQSVSAVRIEEDEDEDEDDSPKGSGCLKGIIYAFVVLLVAGVLSYILIVGGLDITGITRSDVTVDITIPAGASSETVAQVLKENGLIDQSLFFRVYAKLTKADGKWQPGDFSVRGNMGYELLIKELQTMKERKTVKVTIPEGFTVYKIAERLEREGVCTTNEFYRALKESDYSDYAFIAALDGVDAVDREARYYPLEGYLFPDTYEFYAGCSGETAVRRLLDGFDMRLSTQLRTAAAAKDLTIDELIILASIVQGEAASKDDMVKVARVLWNRLDNATTYPKLQCDSTRDYVTDMMAANTDITMSDDAYDTYICDGLPAGAINNPGLDAIKAVLYPSEDDDVMQCYFFATDYKTGKTYFSKTYNQHVQICKRYGIGMYG